MKFEEFAKLSKTDISRFKDKYFTITDYSGSIPTIDVGILFSLNNTTDIEKFKDLCKTLKPILLQIGTKENQEIALTEANRISKYEPYFENNGFAIILKIPC